MGKANGAVKAAKKASKAAPAKTKASARKASPAKSTTNARAYEEPAAEWVDLADLVPWAKNPRDNDENAKRVAKMIIRFGFGAPLTARRANREVIAGHCRVKAVGLLPGLWELAPADERAAWHPGAVRLLERPRVPVRFMDLTAREAHLQAVADNRATELSPWTHDLPDVLSDFGLDEVELAGWSSEDLSEMSKGLLGGDDEGGELDDDEVPEPPKDPITRPGDVWLLGEHVLACDDCTRIGRLFGDEKASLLVTDPPYGVDYGAKNKRLNAQDGGARIETEIENDALSVDELRDFLAERFKAVRVIMASGACYYVTAAAGKFTFAMMEALVAADFPLRHELVWVKNNHVFGACDYHYKHEPILYGWVDGSHRKVADRSQMSTWEIDRPQQSKLHPTMKPVELYGRAMRNSSARGELVVEPYAGSGTAFVAAEQLGRRVRGTEIEPAYCDVIVERWQKLTGGKAVRR